MQLSQRISQVQAQVQTQKMSQTQIMSLKLLNMSTQELRSAIYEKAAKNPALVVTADSFQDGEKNAKVSVQNENRFSDNTYYGKATAAGIQASDNFQAALENREDFREPLSDHLLHQLNSMNLSDSEKNLCEKLIYNLDKNGFNTLAPESLVGKNAPEDEKSPEFLEKCKWIVQNLDPVGTCTNNFEESLLVQAKIKGNASKCTIFLLNHFDFLNPPQTAKIKKKIENYFKESEKLAFNQNQEKFDFEDEDIQESLDFIKTLDPFPARNFGTSQASYVIPDVIIEEIKNDESDSENDDKIALKVSLSREIRPRIAVAKDYENLIEKTKIADGDTSEKAERQKAELKFARSSVNDAKVFIESVEYRESTILKSCEIIAKVQRNFFLHGPKYLAPLRQKDVAEALKVHETTISRMANSKYISCKWGIFPISYFFTNAVGNVKNEKSDENQNPAKENSEDSKQKKIQDRKSNLSENQNMNQPEQNIPASKEAIKAEIAEILETHKGGKKALSDQKISDLLAEKGIKIARRTVAKYRGELNISSSYER